MTSDAVEALERRVAELEEENARLRRELGVRRGALRLCSWCRKIRDGQDGWGHLDGWLTAHVGIEFTHGICPGCAEKLKAEDVR